MVRRPGQSMIHSGELLYDLILPSEINTTSRVEGEDQNYRLHFGDYTGTAGDNLKGGQAHLNHNGMEFTTHDKDNDKKTDGNCASYMGGWWFNKQVSFGSSSSSLIYHLQLRRCTSECS